MAAERQTNGASRAGVQVIERGARILHALAEEPGGLSLSQIAGRAGLARSTVHRLVTALQDERLVAPATTNGRFRLGPAVAMLGMAAQREITMQFHQHLLRLSRELDETVDLAVLDHDRVLFVDQVSAPRRLQAVSAVGSSFPAYCTANGKALLARLPAAKVMDLLPERLEPMTPNTITRRAELLEELERVRTTGIAFDREEHTLGICAVGAAIGEPDIQLGALSVPMPAPRFYGNEQRLVAALRATCDDIEASLAQPSTPNRPGRKRRNVGTSD